MREEKFLNPQWIPITDRLPVNDEYILLSFENNYLMPAIGRYEEDETGGAFYVNDSDKPCTARGIFVNAWMPLPECYKREEDE